jgi:hypothetical protein
MEADPARVAVVKAVPESRVMVAAGMATVIASTRRG